MTIVWWGLASSLASSTTALPGLAGSWGQADHVVVGYYADDGTIVTETVTASDPRTGAPVLRTRELRELELQVTEVLLGDAELGTLTLTVPVYQELPEAGRPIVLPLRDQR
ncbi:MAG: hypothetical protein AAF211_23500, partial [Myxococcota bacterium]